MSGFRELNEVADAKATRKRRQAFYTPPSLVEAMVRVAEAWPYARCLEPSAGDGRILHALVAEGVQHVDCWEIDAGLHPRLRELGAAGPIGADFLAAAPVEPYDRIVMNPPFKGRTYERHLLHAWSLLAPGGRIVALTPTTAAEPLTSCAWPLPGCLSATFEAVATGHFKEYGSNVEVLLVVLDREGPGDPVPVLGFSNQPTCNAALTIETTSALRHVARDATSPEHLRALAAPAIGREGGSCYGVDWREVLDHLRGREAMSAADDAGDRPAAP